MRLILDLRAATESLQIGGDPATMTPEQRIASVWPLVCNRVAKFVTTLKHRERVNWDADDIAQSLWVALRSKDHKWSPERGAYASFAAVVIANQLCSIRDTAGTVEGPRNVVDRMKEYQAEADAGTITPVRAKTFESIRRAVGEFKPVGESDHLEYARPDVEAEEAEARSMLRSDIANAMRDLTPLEARVAGLSYGLWGQEQQTANQIAALVGCKVGAVRQAKNLATEKIRKRLRAAGHPHIASDN